MEIEQTNAKQEKGGHITGSQNEKNKKGGQLTNSRASVYVYVYVCIYIYAVELKTGPIFAFSSVKNWSIFFCF